MVVAVAGCDGAKGKPPAAVQQDPAQLIAELTRGISPSNPYRDPKADERTTIRQAARAIADQDANGNRDRLFSDLGFVVHRGTDPATGRAFDMYIATGTDKRTWGAVLIDTTRKPGIVLEVPHTGFDLNTEKLGLALHREVDSSVLLVAGAHRQAAGGLGDVAHNDKSLFHLFATELAGKGLEQLQLHGYADKNLPDSEAVVSTGKARVGPLAREVADALADAGVDICRAWKRRCGELEGKTNAQGRVASLEGDQFVHVEMSYSIRRDPGSWDRLVPDLAARINEG
ncbi:hypothetical protein ACWT_8226 [Actinoplanes sp. SE50]|nr:hypothetical protein ACPL_8359 [Actinoplanes sp. SE50/110]ATO87641.1 hypothetical protein ACWT_8226 [Actinoplanes sp. SE50]SLM05060.1 hypothetical protein ACSP50_8376 [Actinoplanes sp. SE50/110]